MGGIKRWPSDILWSKYIRTRDNWTCQRCNKKYNPPTSALHCSHFHGRGVWTTRFDEDNCEALCYGCHNFLGSRPVEHLEHKIAVIGKRRVNALQIRKNKPIAGAKKMFLSKEFRFKIQNKLNELEKGDLKWLNDK